MFYFSALRFGPDRKSLASLSAILVAVGEVVGGILFGMLASIFTKKGRWPIVVLGGVLSLLTYSFMFINFPMEANDNDETDEIGFINPNKALALTTSFILGFSDSCFNTQVKHSYNLKYILYLDIYPPIFIKCKPYHP